MFNFDANVRVLGKYETKTIHRAKTVHKPDFITFRISNALMPIFSENIYFHKSGLWPFEISAEKNYEF